MKKIIIVISLVIMCIILVGCSHKKKDSTGTEQNVIYGFIELKDMGDYCYICLDENTNICYYILQHDNRVGISPYYIIGENGEPEIAIYNKNFKLTD